MTRIHLDKIQNVRIRRSASDTDILIITLEECPDRKPHNKTIIYANLTSRWELHDETHYEEKKGAAEAAPIMLKDQAD